MDRQKVYRAMHNISLRQKVGTAQNLYLGGAQARGVGAGGNFTLSSTVQRICLLQTVNIDGTDALGLISDISVAGLSTFTSDKDCALGMFQSKSYQSQNRSLGISVSNNQQIVIQGSSVTGGNFGAAIGIDPLEAAKSPQDQAQAYSFAFGLGQINVGAGASATLQAVATRDVTLGQLMLFKNQAAGALDDLVVTSVKVSGLEMLNASAATVEIPIQVFGAESSDPCTDLGYPINSNAIGEVTVKNFSGAGIDVAGGIFCEPWK